MDYMATGRPIVSTDLPECRLYSDLFDVAEDADAFIERRPRDPRRRLRRRPLGRPARLGRRAHLPPGRRSPDGLAAGLTIAATSPPSREATWPSISSPGAAPTGGKSDRERRCRLGRRGRRDPPSSRLSRRSCCTPTTSARSMRSPRPIRGCTSAPRNFVALPHVPGPAGPRLLPRPQALREGLGLEPRDPGAVDLPAVLGEAPGAPGITSWPRTCSSPSSGPSSRSSSAGPAIATGS